jgi:hypothetical protein
MKEPSRGKMTDFLYARPSAIEGVGRILDFFGTMQTYNQSRSPEEADAHALRNDFRTIGQDIATAVMHVKKTETDKTT